MYTENEKSTGLDVLTDATSAVGDLVIVGDVSDSGRAKAMTWTSVRAWLKSYFDTLYPSGSGTSTGTNTGDETTTTAGALINGATAKTTPVDADYVGLMDSAASNILKKLSWANLKATLKTYFDTLYGTAPFFQQDVATSIVQDLDNDIGIFGSNSDGSVIYFTSDTTEYLFRFTRDTSTGQYLETHEINPTRTVAANDGGAIIVIGSFIYLFTNDSTNIICTRFSAAARS